MLCGVHPRACEHSQNAVIHTGSVVLRAAPILQPALLKIAAEAFSTLVYSTSSWHALLTLLITLATFHFVPYPWLVVLYHIPPVFCAAFSCQHM